MEVILLEKISKLGELGDKVKVKPGFGRNYLIPQGKAVSATKENIKQFEARRAELEKAANETLAEAEDRKVKIESLASVTIMSKAGTEGKLFGSVGTNDIADAVTQAGIPLERKEVRLPAGPLRVVGEHEVELHLHTDVDVNIKVVVEAE